MYSKNEWKNVNYSRQITLDLVCICSLGLEVNQVEQIIFLVWKLGIVINFEHSLPQCNWADLAQWNRIITSYCLSIHYQFRHSIIFLRRFVLFWNIFIYCKCIFKRFQSVEWRDRKRETETEWTKRNVRKNKWERTQ